MMEKMHLDLKSAYLVNSKIIALQNNINVREINVLNQKASRLY